MKVAAIITAAGIGKRMGAGMPKQFLEISGTPILILTLRQFDRSKFVDSLIITSEPTWIDDTINLVKKAGLKKEWQVVAGGNLRQDSVKNGLEVVQGDTDIVVIHDGVRPFITPELIDRSVEVANDTGGCIVAVPVKDTIKLSDGRGIVKKTIDRTHLWAAQTPQTFKYNEIKKAFTDAYNQVFFGTDDASLMEEIGLPVTLIEGSNKNIKITTPEDLEIAEGLLGRENNL